MEPLMGSSGQNNPESAGSSSTLSGGGLRFGQKIYFEDGSGAGLNKNRVNTGRKSMTARCQVEGCRMDLSNAKTYYSRHKVCCVHSKSSKVIVSGLPQRFCQQCSRFHQLSEFDSEKRSCRRRLACHNERRRKPQATTTLLTSRYASIAPSLYGNGIRSVLGDPTTWSTARGSAPWQSHQLMNVFSYGNSSFTNSTDSSCALSLLSNSNPTQQEQQRLQAPTNTWRPSLNFDSAVADRVTMAQPPPVSIQNQYLNQTWEFMSGEKSNARYISPSLGQNQISEPVDFQISNDATMGGVELSLHQQVLRQYLEPENTRAYGSSPQHFNWSL
ncbi:Squamosa promoter-binding-like protein 15 [Hirschfeldia incana]|nr:Squamosa promoter-binding-like protein 15 [Hirschfeldia incana]